MNERLKIIAAAFVLATSAQVIGTAEAVNLTWTGTLASIEVAGGSFNTALEGDGFLGSFSYPDTAGAPDTLEPDEADWEFSGASIGASISHAVTTIDSSSANVNVQNDHPLTDEEASLVAILLGDSVSAGTKVDVWTAGGLEDGAFFDSSDTLRNGVNFEIVFLTRDTTLFSDLSFQAVPPAIGAVQLAAFFIEEADSAGNTRFAAYGFLDSTTVVPIPAALPLYASALAGLGMLGWRRRRCR